MIVNKISRIGVIVGDDNGRGVFIFSMKLLFVMKSEIIVERTSGIAYMLCKKR